MLLFSLRFLLLFSLFYESLPVIHATLLFYMFNIIYNVISILFYSKIKTKTKNTKNNNFHYQVRNAKPSKLRSTLYIKNKSTAQTELIMLSVLTRVLIMSVGTGQMALIW